MGQDIEPFFVCSQEVYGTGDCILGSFFREGRKPYIYSRSIADPHATLSLVVVWTVLSNSATGSLFDLTATNRGLHLFLYFPLNFALGMSKGPVTLWGIFECGEYIIGSI